MMECLQYINSALPLDPIYLSEILVGFENAKARDRTWVPTEYKTINKFGQWETEKKGNAVHRAGMFVTRAESEVGKKADDVRDKR